MTSFKHLGKPVSKCETCLKHPVVGQSNLAEHLEGVVLEAAELLNSNWELLPRDAKDKFWEWLKAQEIMPNDEIWDKPYGQRVNWKNQSLNPPNVWRRHSCEWLSLLLRESVK